MIIRNNDNNTDPQCSLLQIRAKRSEFKQFYSIAFRSR